MLDETYTLVRFRIHHQASVELHQKIERIIAGKFLKVIHITSELAQASIEGLSAEELSRKEQTMKNEKIMNKKVRKKQL